MDQDFLDDVGGTASAILDNAGSGPSAAFTGPVVGIGASAGGLEALREMLARAHPPTGLAFVIVQHLDPNHESMLAQLLDRHTGLKVRQCEGGEQIEGDTVFIIPPGRGSSSRTGSSNSPSSFSPVGCGGRSTTSSCRWPWTSRRTPPA